MILDAMNTKFAAMCAEEEAWMSALNVHIEQLARLLLTPSLIQMANHLEKKRALGPDGCCTHSTLSARRSWQLDGCCRTVAIPCSLLATGRSARARRMLRMRRSDRIQVGWWIECNRRSSAGGSPSSFRSAGCSSRTRARQLPVCARKRSPNIEISRLLFDHPCGFNSTRYRDPVVCWSRRSTVKAIDAHVLRATPTPID